MVRILYVIENIFFGGGERVFGQLIQGLDKEGFHIYVACRAEGIFIEKIRNRAEIIPFDMRGPLCLSKIGALAKIIREKNIQIVHSQGGRADFFARLAARCAKVPIVSTIAAPVEEYEVCTLKKLLYVMLDRFSERSVDKFIVVSEALKEVLVQKHKIPENKIATIYNGIEVDEYYSNAGKVSRIKQDLKVGEGVRLVGAIGRLAQVKGFKYFLEAIEIIERKEKRSNIKYLIVGEGRLRKKLEELADKLKIKEKVIFTGFRKDIKDILASLEILVLPSIREGQPIVALEAMASGLPIVATNFEGVNETIENGRTGMLVPVKDVKALAEAIVSVLDDSKKAERLVSQARAVVSKKFNIEDKIAQHQRLYEKLLIQHTLG